MPRPAPRARHLRRLGEWLTANPAKRSTTLARDRVVLKTHLIPSLGARPLASITPAHVKGCVDAMGAKLAPTTVLTNLGVLKSVTNAAIDADLLARSPVRNLRLSSGPPRRRPTLTPGELSHLAEAMPPTFRALVLTAGLLGLRWSEAAGLRVRDVDFLHRAIPVHQTLAEVGGIVEVAPTKSRASRRTLSAPPFLIDELEVDLQHADYAPRTRVGGFGYWTLVPMAVVFDMAMPVVQIVSVVVVLNCLVSAARTVTVLVLIVRYMFHEGLMPTLRPHDPCRAACGPSRWSWPRPTVASCTRGLWGKPSDRRAIGLPSRSPRLAYPGRSASGHCADTSISRARCVPYGAGR